ncbi:MAG: hypothetical protein WBG58_18605 [Ignavibacteriaceae bacterium]
MLAFLKSFYLHFAFFSSGSNIFIDLGIGQDGNSGIYFGIEEAF